MLLDSINPGTMSKFLKKDQITSSWYEIDAKNAVVGRLATIVSNIIRNITNLAQSVSNHN